MRYLIRIFIILLVTTCLSANSQDNDKKEQFHYEIRTAYRLVYVTVLDEDGNHIKGLQKKDFYLLQGGKAQKILSVEEVDHLKKGDTSNSTTHKENKSNSDPFLEQIEEEQAQLKKSPVWYILLLANLPENSDHLTKITEGTIDFLNESFLPSDRGSIFVIKADRIQKLLGFTANKQLLIGQFKKIETHRRFFARKHDFTTPASQNYMLSNLQSFIDKLKSINGRKHILLFTCGLPSLDSDFADLISSNYEQTKKQDTYNYDLLLKDLDISNTTINIIDLTSRRRGTSNIAGRHSNSSYTRISTPDPTRGNLNVNDRERLKLASDLALIGGGRVFKRALYKDKMLDILNSIHNESSHFYIIGYSPADTKEQRKIDEIEITVAHEDVDKLIYKKYVPAFR